ncbi:hypothetical protein ACFLZ0_00735 [Patescibacteria group bacterium]
MKTIYIEPDEEIISVIDRVDRAEGDCIGIAIPKNAQIWQSSINLKLLKREANNSNKKVVLVVPSDLDYEMAEKTGFEIRRVKDIQAEAELIRQEEDKEAIEEHVDEADDDSNEDEYEDDVDEYNEAETVRKKDDMINILVNEMESNSSNLFTKESMGQKDGQSKKSPKYKVDEKNPLLRNNSLDMSLFSRKKVQKRVVKKMPVKIAESFIWGKFFACFIGLAIILTSLVVYFVLPTAEIEIYPNIETINFDLSVSGSKDIMEIDTDLNKIPLQEIRVEKTISKEFESTGEKDLAEKATGIITIYNEYSSDPQTLVATTRFRSPDGKIFRITKNIIVPGAKIENAKIVPNTLDVEVVADQPGPDYNIEPSEFTIPGFKGSPKYVGFYGKSTESMSGGAIGRVKVVIAEDMDGAEDILREELFDSVKESLQKEIPDGFGLIEDSIQENIIEKEFSVEQDEEAESFTLNIKAEALALAYKKYDLKSIIDLNLIAEVDDNKKILSDSQEFEWTGVEFDEDKEEVSLSLSVRENVSLDVDISSIKNDLAGKNEIEARKYFSGQTDIQKVKFSFWPFWVKKIPTKQSRIKITTIYSE